MKVFIVLSLGHVLVLGMLILLTQNGIDHLTCVCCGNSSLKCSWPRVL